MKLSGVQEVVNHYFKLLGYSEQNIKDNSKEDKSFYVRHVKNAKDLIELSGGIEKAKQAISRMDDWANDRALDYNINTVIKKWLEITP